MTEPIDPALGDDLLVGDSLFDAYTDAVIDAFAEAVIGGEPGLSDVLDTSVTDAADSGQATFSDSGDSITTLPDGSVSFSGTTVGGESISFNSDIGTVDYSGGFDAGY